MPSCFSLTPADAKRLIGRKFDDAVVQSDMKHWPFKVVNDSTKPKVEVEYKGEMKSFYPEEISSMVLTKMKEISEAYLGKVGNDRCISQCYKCHLMRTDHIEKGTQNVLLVDSYNALSTHHFLQLFLAKS